jgi:hypothetical protein
MNKEPTFELFRSVDDMHQSNRQETLDICSRNGFNTMPVDDGRILTCSAEGAAEVIEVFKNGAWEYRNISATPPVVTQGMSAVFLKYFFHAPEQYLSASAD